MIISASRRTDIPAYHAPWLMERLREGFAMVANPMNPHQVRRVDLRPEAVDGIVFWSKNPAPLLAHEKALRAYRCAWQFTLNAYAADVEPGVPGEAARLETLKRLADAFGPERVEWRYDPILISAAYPAEWHLASFERLARAIAPYARGCTISFVDFYRCALRGLRACGARDIALEERQALAQQLQAIADACRLPLRACCEEGLPLAQAHCVNAADFGLPAKADKNQRPGCGCAPSADIGAYGTCPAGCAYCYARGRSHCAAR